MRFFWPANRLVIKVPFLPFFPNGSSVSKVSSWPSSVLTKAFSIVHYFLLMITGVLITWYLKYSWTQCVDLGRRLDLTNDIISWLRLGENKATFHWRFIYILHAVVWHVIWKEVDRNSRLHRHNCLLNVLWTGQSCVFAYNVHWQV